MELNKAFQTLESRLPPGDPEAREAFEKVRMKIMHSASMDALSEIERSLRNGIADVRAATVGNGVHLQGLIKRLALHLENDTPASKSALVEFLREGR